MPQSTEKTLTFRDNYLPGLKAGSYRLTISQSLTDSDGKPVGESADYLAPVTQYFDVCGPRFSLPSQDLHSVYPPIGAVGHFSEVLPQVVLTQPTLPWERDMNGGAAASTVPWMALLLLRESELEQTHGGDVRTWTVAEFLTAEADVLKPALDNLSTADGQETCRSIRLSSNTFRAVAPRFESEQDNELSYLAHCRTLQTASDGDPANGSVYSVVIGKRLAVPVDGQGTTTFVACLVSLEGLAASLPPATIKPGSSVDLILLYSWSFTCVPDKGKHFSTLVEHLAGPRHQPGDLLLRVPVAAGSKGEAADRIDNGYVPLAHATTVGATTFAWYRGPLTPVPAQRLPQFAGQDADFRVDSWRIYDPTHAVFDQSYAAAWQLGRALALADGVFAANLLRLRNALNDGVSSLAARADHLAGVAQTQALARQPQPLLGERVMHERLDTLLRDPRNWRSPAPGVGQRLAGAQRAPAPLRSALASQRALMVDPAARRALGARLAEAEPDALQQVQDWLARLTLLEGVPFWYLVPSNAMLPNESLRFFYVDAGWLQALRAGALSIGIQSSKNVQQHADLVSAIGAPGSAPVAGFLLRSALISAFPNLVIAAGTGSQTPTEVPADPLVPLRKQNLAADVLLCLYPQSFDSLLIGEPKHTLCFGVEDDGATQLWIALRDLTGQVGVQRTQDSKPVKFSMNPYVSTGQAAGEAAGVLDVSGLVKGLGSKLAGQLGDYGFTSADLAVQMLRAPEAVQLETPIPSPSASTTAATASR